ERPVELGPLRLLLVTGDDAVHTRWYGGSPGKSSESDGAVADSAETERILPAIGIPHPIRRR
ncbi:hypothetical protein, partial [Haloferax sp. KTX1]|uniref:hypothetical protein n=1 Tax=Haloferax sp. KTX1 TaxID=2600597 RepID=UPI001C9E3B27